MDLIRAVQWQAGLPFRVSERPGHDTCNSPMPLGGGNSGIRTHARREPGTVLETADIAHLVKGVLIKEGSMKQGLRLLQKDKAIERRGLRYFPTKNGGQSND